MKYNVATCLKSLVALVTCNTIKYVLQELHIVILDWQLGQMKVGMLHMNQGSALSGVR